MCTRVFWNTNALAKLTGRSMDWPVSTEPMIIVFPRGIERHGGQLGPDRVIAENAVMWTSRYGSMTTSIYGLGSADGLNERGLAVHMLFLRATDFGPRDPSKPGLVASLWAQYLLDNAATVEEALALHDDINLVMVGARGRDATVHLALEDASGDSAIIEYIDGQKIVHHGPEFRIMTNDPAYDQQLELLGQQDFSKPSRDMPLPGNVNPVDRFQRAAYYSALLPEPKNTREAVAGVLAIVRNCSVPFGAPYGEFGIYNTEYRTVTDSTNRRYFFELTNSPNVIWAELDRFNLEAGAPVMQIDPDDITLSGDVSEKFTPVDHAPF
jgi:choloylglycine hydrolase